MQAATVEALVQKGQFEPRTALAVAEAIGMAITSSQVVTVPLFVARPDAMQARMDARFAESDARFAESEAKMNARFTELDTRMNARFQAVDARFVSLEAYMDVRFKAAGAETDAKLQSMKTELVFWIVGMTVGSAFLPKLVSTLSQAIQGLH